MILIRVISGDMISKPIFDLTSGKEAIVSKSLQADVERLLFRMFSRWQTTLKGSTLAGC